MDGMWRAARDAAGLLRGHRGDTIHIVTHIDADALSAAGIAATALRRAGIDFRVTYCKSLDDATLERIRDDNAALRWFTDLGSAVHDRLGSGPRIITDHHEVDRLEGALSFPHVNPHLHGIEQDDSISGAGAAYLVATALDPKNADLAANAIVGALGDLQDQRLGRLDGLNRRILADGEAHGVLRGQPGLRFFGRSTRPLPKFLRYAEPQIPGLGANEDDIVEFLVANQVRVRDGTRWRCWLDLAEDERARLTAAISERWSSANLPTERLHGEVYDLPREKEPELRCAKEFATLLNSTARYDRPEVGLALVMGERGTTMGEARTLLRGHRRSLGDALQLAGRLGLTSLGPIAYYEAGDEIRDTILGIVTGIILGNGKARPDQVVVGLADNRAGAIKVSARAPDLLVRQGADLSIALRTAAEAVAGNGGGHAGAAGATIPNGREGEFLKRLSDMVASQIGAATKSISL